MLVLGALESLGGASWLVIGGLMLVAYILGVVSTPIFGKIGKQLFGPKLKVDFDRSSCLFRHKERREGPTADVETTYRLDVGYCKVRLKVSNVRSRALKNCRGVLLRVERRGAKSGQFEETHYKGALPLAWLDKSNRETIDLDKGGVDYLDVLATDTMSRGFMPGLTVAAPEYDSLWRDPGVYRLTVQVSADGADPERALLLLDWKGHWENFDVQSA